MVFLYIFAVASFWLICSYSSRFLTTMFILRDKDRLHRSFYDFDDHNAIFMATLGGPISLVVLFVTWIVTLIREKITALKIRDPQDIAIDFANKRKKKS